MSSEICSRCNQAERVINSSNAKVLFCGATCKRGWKDHLEMFDIQGSAKKINDLLHLIPGARILFYTDRDGFIERCAIETGFDLKLTPDIKLPDLPSDHVLILVADQNKRLVAHYSIPSTVNCPPASKLELPF